MEDDEVKHYVEYQSVQSSTSFEHAITSNSVPDTNVFRSAQVMDMVVSNPNTYLNKILSIDNGPLFGVICTGLIYNNNNHLHIICNTYSFENTKFVFGSYLSSKTVKYYITILVFPRRIV